MYPPSTSSDSEGNDGLKYIFIRTAMSTRHLYDRQLVLLMR